MDATLPRPPIRARRGLDLPIPGRLAGGAILEAPAARWVGLTAQDVPGTRARLLVQEGQTVRLGEPLFVDRRDEEAPYGAPAAGKVARIHRGDRRALLAVEIEVGSREEQVELDRIDALGASPAALRAAVLRAGLWPVLRQRPFDRVPHSSSTPAALLVTAMDTRPLAPEPLQLLAGREAAFRHGLAALARMVEAPTWLCVAGGTEETWARLAPDGVRIQGFTGPHPAGTPGFHIHRLAPVGPGRASWHIGCQDTADIGALFLEGRIPTRRVVALVGPAVREPVLLACRRGAGTAALTEGRLAAAEPRVISGSVLEGRTAAPGGPEGFLGRYANQVTVLEDRTEKGFLTWALPLAGRFSWTNSLLDKLLGRRLIFDTDTNGARRAIVPIGQYETVMPLDILPTQLIKALAADDIERAEKLGVLELAEEDLALCEFADPSKQPLTLWLRNMLTRIEKEG